MNSLYRTLLGILAITAGGCANRAPLACPDASPNRSARVFFATDRKPEPNGGILRFGRERTDPPGLTMGWEQVKLGAAHRMGKLDSHVALTAAHQRATVADPVQQPPLQQSDADIATFVEKMLRPAIRASAAPRKGGAKQVLLFLHGYNNTFDYAVRKTAQLAGDLGFVGCDGERQGVAVAYSWPAQGAVLSYLADEENAEWTQQRLVPFLEAMSQVCRQERAELTVVAHSMGCRALVRSLSDIANSCAGRHRRGTMVDHVVLLAPDIGRGLFDQYLERLLPLVGDLNIYVSSKDHALQISSLLHGGHRRLGFIESTFMLAFDVTGKITEQLTGFGSQEYRELGQSSMPFDKSGKVYMIDVSQSLAATLGHSYEDPAFIRDLSALIHEDARPGTGSRKSLIDKTPNGSILRNAKGLRYFKLDATGK